MNPSESGNAASKRGDRWPTPRELAQRRCRARIDGKHEWVYVGGGKYRCAGCGAE